MPIIETYQWSSKTFIIVKNRKFYSLSWNKLIRLIIFFHMLFDIDALDFVSFRSFSFSFFYFFSFLFLYICSFFFYNFSSWLSLHFFFLHKLLGWIWSNYFECRDVSHLVFFISSNKIKTYVIRELVNFQYLCYLNYRNWQ